MIKNNTIALYENWNADSGRAIASIHTIQTMNVGNSVTKIMNFEGKRYYIHIENKDSTNSVDDYVAIRSKQGHEMIYPLECQKSL